jgi:site-specific DNA recombinase
LDRLVDLRLLDEFDAETYRSKNTELTSERTRLTDQINASDRQQSEDAAIILKTFELSQTLENKWATADIPEKRQILEIVGLNYTLSGVTLDTIIRKPFDVLVKGLLMKNGRGERT